MQDLRALRQPLLGELAMSWNKREERERENAIYSGHLQSKDSARTLLGPIFTISPT